MWANQSNVQEFVGFPSGLALARLHRSAARSLHPPRTTDEAGEVMSAPCRGSLMALKGQAKTDPPGAWGRRFLQTPTWPVKSPTLKAIQPSARQPAEPLPSAMVGAPGRPGVPRAEAAHHVGLQCQRKISHLLRKCFAIA